MKKTGVRLTVDRFRENGMENPEIDEHGNAHAILRGTEGGSSILVMAHADSVFDSNIQHVLNVGPNSITGPGIADNAIGLATVVALPKILQLLNIQFKDDLILLANTKSLGRGNLEGADTFWKRCSVQFVRVSVWKERVREGSAIRVLALCEVK